MTGPSGVCRIAQVRFDGVRLRADWDAGIDIDVYPVKLHPTPEPVPVSREPLTARQQRIVAFIAAHIDEHGYPPSYREISAAVGLKSPNSVRYQVGELRRLGFLAEPAGGCQARALKLIKGGVA